MTDADEPMYRLSEVARTLGVALSTVRLWVSEGKLQAEHPRPRAMYLVRESELQRLLVERAGSSAGAPLSQLTSNRDDESTNAAWPERTALTGFTDLAK